ncbi:MAG: rhomboid family intramembrane serine protease [Bacteroidia bacterium]
MEQDYIDAQHEEKPKNKSPFHAFVPKGDYFFTPIILGINVLIFVLMVASGVSPMLPSSVDLAHWGANKFALTTGGQPWRLFTSMFLHFGIIHLAVNMYALYSLGRMIEPFIGKWRFLFLYLFAGLGGSAVSLWWHANDLSVSAGASGAIFGLFGLFAAVLTTDLIRQDVRKDLLKSMGKAIVFNLLIGLYGGIDNSAHIGGLLTGMAGGYLSYYDIRDWYAKRINKYRGVIATGILTTCIVFFFWMMLPKPLVEGKEDVDVLFERYDAERMAAFEYSGRIDSTTSLEEIQNNITRRWAHCLNILDSVKTRNLPGEGLKYVEKIRATTLWGVKSAEFYERSVKEHRKDLIDSGNAMLITHNKKLQQVNDEANAKEK